MLPIASAGAIFHASISSGKFHGMIWPQTPKGLGVGQFALHQLGHARVIVEMPLRQRDVDVTGLADRFAVVERFRAPRTGGCVSAATVRGHREPLRGRDRPAFPFRLGVARSFDCGVHIVWVRLGQLCEEFAIGGLRLSNTSPAGGQCAVDEVAKARP